MVVRLFFAQNREAAIRLELQMKELVDITNSLSGMPLGTLSGFVILAGFGLAAFAIYAVLVASRGDK